MKPKLKDKVVVVTGATSGIGLETSMLLLRKGACCYLLGRDFSELKARIKKSNIGKDNFHLIPVDLDNDSDIVKLIQELNKEVKIDILIHSAGIIHLGLFEKINVEKLDEQYRINLRVPFLLTQKLLPKIKNSKGIIVFVNSTAGLSAWEDHCQYSATKFGLKAFAESLRLEMKPFGVRVSSVFPGATATPMQKRIQNMAGQNYNKYDFLQAIEVAQSIIDLVSFSTDSNVTDLTIRPNK